MAQPLSKLSLAETANNKLCYTSYNFQAAASQKDNTSCALSGAINDRTHDFAVYHGKEVCSQMKAFWTHVHP